MSRPFINLVNQRYGKLTVISKMPSSPGVKMPYWNCLCDCGRTVSRVTAPSLRKGLVTSCKHCVPLPPLPKGRLPPCTAEGKELKSIPKFTPFGLPLKSKRKDLTGKTFGRWKALGISAHDPGKWVTQCLCGKMGLVSQHSLQNGMSRSCGCAKNKLTKVTKGQLIQEPANPLFIRSDSNPVFFAWRMMKHKCYNPNYPGYAANGAMGVEVHPGWKDNFEAFATHVGFQPKPGYSIQRLNPMLNFVPGNTCWAPKRGHPDDERFNPTVTYQGQILRLNDLASRLGLPRNLLRYYTVVSPRPLDQAIEMCRTAITVLDATPQEQSHANPPSPQSTWV